MHPAPALARAYSAAGEAWHAGPGRMYDRLAEVLVARSPVPLTGRVVLDVGAGTGAASRAISRAGGCPVALDPAVGMLVVDRADRPPAVAADAQALPVATDAVGGAVAAFSFNHVDDAVLAFREAARVTASGGPLVVSTYADDDTHPARDAVLHSLRARGWREPAWYTHVREVTAPALATVDRCAAAARAAGLDPAVEHITVAFADYDAAALVAWRLGMAHIAPFVAALPACDQEAVAADALDRLGDDWPPLVRSILITTARA